MILQCTAVLLKSKFISLVLFLARQVSHLERPDRQNNIFSQAMRDKSLENQLMKCQFWYEYYLSRSKVQSIYNPASDQFKHKGCWLRQSLKQWESFSLQLIFISLLTSMVFKPFLRLSRNHAKNNSQPLCYSCSCNITLIVIH